MKLLNSSGKLFDRIIHFLFYVGCFLLFFIMLAVCYDVLMRYFFMRPQTWVGEVVSYCMIFMTFLASTWVLRKGQHVALDLVIERINPRNQMIVSAATSLVATVMWFILCIFAVKTTLILFQRGEVISSLLEPPKWILVSIVPLGSFLLGAQSLRGCVGYFMKIKRTATRTREVEKIEIV